MAFPTTTEPNTSPTGVLPAEDPAHRDKVIISVVAAVVGVSLTTVLLIFYLRRYRNPNIPAQGGGFQEVFPPIQPDMLRPADMRNVIPNGGSGHEGDNVFQIRIPSEDELRDQAKLKSTLKEQQSAFRLLREERRRSRTFSEDPQTNPRESKDHQASAKDSCGIPTASSEDEVAIRDRLTSTAKRPLNERQSLYKELIVLWHPDKHPTDTARATRVFQYLQALKSAYLQE
jgi:hypothetical protein